MARVADGRYRCRSNGGSLAHDAPPPRRRPDVAPTRHGPARPVARGQRLGTRRAGAAAAEDDRPAGSSRPSTTRRPCRHAGDTTSFEPGGRVTVGFRAAAGRHRPRRRCRATGPARRAPDRPGAPSRWPRARDADPDRGSRTRRRSDDPDPTDADGRPSRPTPEPTEAPAPSPAATRPARRRPPVRRRHRTRRRSTSRPSTRRPLIVADPVAWTGAAGRRRRSHRRGHAERPAQGDLRVPAVLGAVRQLDRPRLREALDDRLLRRRRARPAAASRRRTRAARRRPAGAAGPARRMTDDHQRRPPQPDPGRADGPELRLVDRRREQARRACSAARPPRSTWRRPIAAAVRDRGADGVNLDFEPIAVGLRRRVHLARALGPGRARQGRARATS